MSAADNLVVTINGTDRTKKTDRYESQITDNANETPNTASLLVHGFTPTVGMSVNVAYNGTTIFDGLVTNRTLIQKRSVEKKYFRLDCHDWTFFLDRRLVTKSWTATSVSTIVSDIISGFTTGFTTTNVESSLDAIDFVAFLERPSAVLTRLANQIGAAWKVLYTKDIYFRVTSNLASLPDLDTANADFRHLTYGEKIDQIGTRCFVVGGGSSAANATGTIASTATVAARPAPATTPTISESATPDSFSTGNFNVKMTFVYSGGAESLPSPASNTFNASGNFKLQTTVEIGDARVTGKRFYYSYNSGGYGSGNNFDDLNDNVSTTLILNLHNLGRTIPSVAAGYSAGATYLYVSDCSKFSATGGTAYVGSQSFTYTGRTASSGVGALTGIPPSGTGSLSGSVSIGAVVGSASLNVTDITPFNSAGGKVAVGSNQIITYGGTTAGSRAAARPAPSGTPTVAESATAASFSPGNYALQYSFLYSDGGESAPTSSSAPFAMSGTKAFRVGLTVGDSRVSGRRIYYNKDSGGFLNGNNLDDVADNSTTTADPLTIHNYGRSPVSSAQGYSAGATYLYVEDTSQFSGTGGTARCGVQTFTYTGRSTSSGVGALTGIPASGTGSLSAAIDVGDVVFPSVGGSGALTGIPISGTGSILYAINAGDPVNIFVQRDDTTAQSVLAALEGGDGIHEFTVSDSALMTDAACQDRGDAELALQSSMAQDSTYITENANTVANASVRVHISGIDVTLKIQQVQFSWQEDRRRPQRRVTVDSAYKTLYQYFADLERQAAKAA